MSKQVLFALFFGAVFYGSQASAIAQGDESDQPRRNSISPRSRLSAEVREIRLMGDGTLGVFFTLRGRFATPNDTTGGYGVRWTRGEGPVPFLVGQEVDLIVAGPDLLQVRLGLVTPLYFRQGPSGLELLVRDENRRPLLVAPQQTGRLSDTRMQLVWIRGTGLVVTSVETPGGGEAEQPLSLEGMPRAAGTTEVEEAAPSRGTAIVPVNAPRRPVQPGRDGWRSVEGI